VKDGAALLFCMAYIDLNAVRGILVDRPEACRYCGLGYHMVSSNKDRFFSIDIAEASDQNESRLVTDLRYVYEVGSEEHPEESLTNRNLHSEVRALLFPPGADSTSTDPIAKLLNKSCS